MLLLFEGEFIFNMGRLLNMVFIDLVEDVMSIDFGVIVKEK